MQSKITCQKSQFTTNCWVNVWMCLQWPFVSEWVILDTVSFVRWYVIFCTTHLWSTHTGVSTHSAWSQLSSLCGCVCSMCMLSLKYLHWLISACKIWLCTETFAESLNVDRNYYKLVKQQFTGREINEQHPVASLKSTFQEEKIENMKALTLDLPQGVIKHPHSHKRNIKDSLDFCWLHPNACIAPKISHVTPSGDCPDFFF